MSDPLIDKLRAIATKGGDRGPFYDRGILSVIAEIDSTGQFTPNKTAIAIHSLSLDIKACAITESEVQSVRHEIKKLDMTDDNAAEYCGGILFAESALSHLAKG